MWVPPIFTKHEWATTLSIWSCVYWTDGCIRVNVRIVNFAAFKSKTFLSRLLSNNVYDPSVLCPWEKALILLKKHRKLLLTMKMQKLLIFPWLKEDFSPINPALLSLQQTKLFLGCNPLLPVILKVVVTASIDTAKVLAELQLLLMQGDQLIGLVPSWRLMNFPVDSGTVAQSSLFCLMEGSVSFLLRWFSYPKIVYSDMVRVLMFSGIYQKT